MAEWRTGRKTGRTLWRDEQLVGLVDSPEVAAEIVETMNRVDRLLDEVRGPKPPPDTSWVETGRERSRPRHAVRCGPCDRWQCCEHCGCDQRQPPDAQRRSEATPKKDLPCPGCGRTSHGMACPAQLAAAVREDAFMRRLDPYDHSKGFTPKNGEHPNP